MDREDRTEGFADYLLCHTETAWQIVLHECKADNVPDDLIGEELTNTIAFARRILSDAIRRWWIAWHALRAHPDFERCDTIVTQRPHNPTVARNISIRETSTGTIRKRKI